MSESVFGYRWVAPSCASQEGLDDIAFHFNLHPSIAAIVRRRVSPDFEKIERFLNPSLKELEDPFGIRGLKGATDRIVLAIKRQENILIHGDYDADGITSTALLYLFLKEVGNTPVFFIPNRLKEGHGISSDSLALALKNRCSLGITCDVGISAWREIEEFKKHGIDVVVTDHHLSSGKLPDAVAIVDPVLEEGSDFRHLAGVGVVFYLLVSLRSALRKEGFFKKAEPDLREHLDLVALGTIADVCPLTGDSRTLVKHGMGKIAASSKAGVRALAEVSGLDLAGGINSGDVAFKLVPRINAAGRMGHGELAFELLATGDSITAYELARKLDRFNIERKKIEENILSQASTVIEDGEGWRHKKAFCLAGRNWHRGVVGLVAGKLSDKYAKTVAVISVDEDECRGSVRGKEPLNVVEILHECRHLLLDYGGHELAGGFSISRENVGNFGSSFVSEVTKRLCSDDLFKKDLFLDGEVRISEINEGFVNSLSRLEPWGPLNTEPNLLSKNVEITNVRAFGNGHTRFVLKKGAGDFIEGVRFGFRIEGIELPARADVVFTPEFNRFNGRKTVRLLVKDLRILG